MVAATKAKPKPSDELKQIVNEVAESMNEPPWQSKLLEAMDYVLTGAVDLGASPIAVKSGAHAYQLDPEHGCTCPDGRLRNRYCKHFVAYEMQKRVDARMRGEDMPAKPKTTPQDEWEAKIQTGDEVDDLFGGPEAEPDDIPEPGVPEKVKQAARAVDQSDKETLDVIEEALSSVITQRHEGHQYVDHPSTLCIKRHVGMTEIMWTFRGNMDEEVWGRASRMIRALDEANKRYAPQQVPPRRRLSSKPRRHRKRLLDKLPHLRRQ